MHALEKIMARAAGKASVETGEIVNCGVDFALINDLYPQTMYSFLEMGGTKVWDPDRAAFIFDHFSPSPTIRTSQIHKEMREFARVYGLTHHFDINRGVCHQVLAEAGLVWPGMLLIVTDSHTTTHGAFGAFGTGVGATDMATILISGELWLRVPEIINIVIEGSPQKGVFAKDVILHILGRLGADAAVYKAIEFSGSYVQGIGVADRMTICNMAVEMGAKTAYMKPNKAVLDYVGGRTDNAFEVVDSDAGFAFTQTHAFDISDLVPQFACPHSVDNVLPATSVERVRVDQAFIGSCTGGRLEDIGAAAAVLLGKHVAPDTRLVVIPASSEVFLRATEAGYVKTLIDAGATFASPGCGPCLGTHAGLLADGEVCVSSTNRNFPGRMGSANAKIYLASPAAVAASALRGVLTDPRDVL
jgi:3-isopropylmalate/(R)-2-methylmalate dehydratase large subunit